MIPEQNRPSGGNERLWQGALIAGAVLVVVLGVVALVLATSGGDETATEASTSTSSGMTTTTEGSTTTTTTVASSTTSAPDSTDLSAWVGDYTWAESIEGGGDSVLHRLDLDLERDDGSGIEGRLVESGYQTDNQIEIVAEPADDGLAVVVDRVTEATSGYAAGDVLLRLVGDPVGPTTRLERLDTLLVDLPTSGSYFLPGEGGATTAPGGPDSGEDPGVAVTLDPEGLRLVVTDSGSARSVTFGSDATSVGESLDGALGPSTTSPASAECPNQASEIRQWAGQLRIEVRDGQFISWSLPPGSPLTTMSGIGLGTTRSEMAQSTAIEVFESSLGTEFSIGSGADGIRGLLDSDESAAPVIELWAGERCVFT